MALSALAKQAQEVLNRDDKVEITLDDLSMLAQELKLAQLKVDQAEDVLKEMKHDVDVIASFIIPKAMAQAGVTQVVLEDGSTMSCSQDVFCAIPKEDLASREQAFNWLRENGGEALIKDQLRVESPTDELIAQLKGKFVSERVQDVNTNSLKSWLKGYLGYKKGEVAQGDIGDIDPSLHVYIKPNTKLKQKAV